jgi:hypothetical protein
VSRQNQAVELAGTGVTKAGAGGVGRSRFCSTAQAAGCASAWREWWGAADDVGEIGFGIQTPAARAGDDGVEDGAVFSSFAGAS